MVVFGTLLNTRELEMGLFARDVGILGSNTSRVVECARII